MISISGPSITQKEIDYVTDAVTNAWYSNANVYHEKFENAFSNFVGRKFAIALPSCTSALHLSLLAAGVGPGDEVIVPDATWIATASPISYVGATPVFADVDAKSWCITAETIRDRITSKTKAVILVDLYGNMPDMTPILQLTEEKGIVVVEDAAEAIGSQYNGQMAGSFGMTSTFSFHGSKTLTTGEGGMLLTDSDVVFQRVLTLRDHGRDTSTGKMFWNSEVAYKYKMSSMQAALGLAQLERIEELVSKKRQIFEWYQKYLINVPVTLNYQADNVLSTYWMVTAIQEPTNFISKEVLIAAMRERKIDCRPFFYPLSSLPAYADLDHGWEDKNPVSYSLSKTGINLPSGLSLTEDDVKVVCAGFAAVLNAVKGS